MVKMKYSEELVVEIVKLVESGASNKDAATLSGITEETFYNWQRPKSKSGEANPDYHPELSESLKKAETKRKVAMVNRILTAATKNWQAAAWYLERRYNDEYGRVDKHEVSLNPQNEIKKMISRINNNEVNENDNGNIETDGNG